MEPLRLGFATRCAEDLEVLGFGVRHVSVDVIGVPALVPGVPPSIPEQFLGTPAFVLASRIRALALLDSVKEETDPDIVYIELTSLFTSHPATGIPSAAQVSTAMAAGAACGAINLLAV